MKNKGFTLIEMLVVIVLIGIILTLAIPSVIRIVENKSSDSYRYQMKMIDQAVNLYQVRYKGELNNHPTAPCFELNYQHLLDEQLLEEEEIKCQGKIRLNRIETTNNFSTVYDLECRDSNNVKFRDKSNLAPNGCVELGLEYEDNLYNIDAPTITGGISTWVPTDVSIYVDNSGIPVGEVKHYEYYTSTSPATPTAYVEVTGITDNRVVISEEGTTYVWYRVVDKEGNISKWSNREIVNIDWTEPVAPTITSLDGISSGGKHTSEFVLMFGGGNNISGNSYYYGTSSNALTQTASSIKVTAEMNGQTIYVQSCSGSAICGPTTSYVVNIEIPEPIVPIEPEDGE